MVDKQYFGSNVNDFNSGKLKNIIEYEFVEWKYDEIGK